MRAAPAASSRPRQADALAVVTAAADAVPVSGWPSVCRARAGSRCTHQPQAVARVGCSRCPCQCVGRQCVDAAAAAGDGASRRHDQRHGAGRVACGRLPMPPTSTFCRGCQSAAGCRGAARHQCGSGCPSAGRPHTGRQQVAAVCLRRSSRSPVGWTQLPAWKCQTVAPQAQGRPKCCRAAVPVLPGVRAGAGGRQCVGPSVVGLPLAACAAALPLRCVLAVGLGRQLRRPWGTELLRMPCRCRPRSCRRRSAAAVDAAAGQPSPVWIHGGPARMSGNKTPDAPAGRRAASSVRWRFQPQLVE